MTPKFSEAVDPLLMHVLRLLERIDKGESPAPKDEKQHIRGWIDQAEAILGQGTDWQLAKYALVVWIDELLIETKWEGRNWWNENALEQEFFGGRRAFHQFYIKAQDASALPRKDALEVFYVCVVLGFRGLYRNPDEAILEAQSHGLPTDLETWAKQTSTAIKLNQGLPPITDRGQKPQGAPALESQTFFLAYLMIAVVLAAVDSMCLAYIWNLLP